MTADLLTNYQHIIESLELITGSKGIFDVKVNNQLIFSKKALGRHAEPEEVLNLFRTLLGPDVQPYPRS